MYYFSLYEGPDSAGIFSPRTRCLVYSSASKKKPATSGNEQTTVCSAMAIKTCPAHKTVWGRWIFRHMFLGTRKDLFRRRPMTSTRSKGPGGLHPQHLASVSLLEPAHKGVLENPHLSSRNNVSFLLFTWLPNFLPQCYASSRIIFPHPF